MIKSGKEMSPYDLNTLEASSLDGVGSKGRSLFIQHPADLSFPSTSEFAAYTVVNPDAHVADLMYLADSSSMMHPSCLSSHARAYPSML